jgi:hypothetical protein
LLPELNFVVDVALILFAVSITFSNQFCYDHLHIFPTMFFYRWNRCFRDPEGRGSLLLLAFDVGSLLALGVFWYCMAGVVSLPVGDFLVFMFYFAMGAFVGLLPWFFYMIIHHLVGRWRKGDPSGLP